MSSVIFQPLLHDSFGWKTNNSTYADTYTWKKHRSTNKTKKVSTYGQQYQRQQQKERKLQQTNNHLPSAINDKQTIEWVIQPKQNDQYREETPATCRYTPIKIPPAVVEEPPVYIVEQQQRPASLNREMNCISRASHRSTSASTVVEETCRPITPFESRRTPREEEHLINESNNNDNRHWIQFPNPKTPQYLIDIKQRLGQLKIPSTLARAKSVANPFIEQRKPITPPIIQRSESSQSNRKPKPDEEKRHFLDFNLPQTPMELRAARQRVDKHRYNPSLDNFPPRPKTCPIMTNDVQKPVTSSINNESDEGQIPSIETTFPKEDLWQVEEQNNLNENEAPSVMVQMVDVEGLPNEYVEALETANVAQEEYLKNNEEKRSDNLVYRLPTLSMDNKNESCIAYRNQQQSTNRNDFGTWVRSASEKERQSAMKIIHDVLNQPVNDYESSMKQQLYFRQTSTPPTNRINSATRKLGRLRTHQQIPCEICEKQLIKKHVWNLNQSETLTCSHQAQGTKPSIIQIRA